MASVPFTNSTCGKTTGESTPLGGALNPGDQVQINGSDDLSTCVVGVDSAKVYSIRLDRQALPPYEYRVSVDCEGPHDAFGWLHLYFTDETGDRYALGIFRRARMVHEVSYNSSDPGIVKIEWNS
jgi:hypothetical protein